MAIAIKKALIANFWLISKTQSWRAKRERERNRDIEKSTQHQTIHTYTLSLHMKPHTIETLERTRFL